MLTHRSRVLTIVAATALAVTLAAPPALAAPPTSTAPVAAGQPAQAGHGPARPGPTLIDLPNGFQPEGIAIGRAPYAYFGSRVDGAIYRAGLVTGEGRIISPGRPGSQSLGMKIDARGRLFVAGGAGGDARVIDVRTGRIIASYPLQSVPAFINDVVLTRHAAYFTDSRNPVLFRLPLGRRGAPPAPARVQRIPLTGDLVYADGINANGITTTPDRRGLLIVQSNTGKLFRVDPRTGVTAQVDLRGKLLPNGDGLLLRGRTLYAVQNRLNTLAVLRLDAAGTRGEVVLRMTDERFDVPTTVASYRNRLYLPNARFTTPPDATTRYTAVAIARP